MDWDEQPYDREQAALEQAARRRRAIERETEDDTARFLTEVY